MYPYFDIQASLSPTHRSHALFMLESSSSVWVGLALGLEVIGEALGDALGVRLGDGAFSPLHLVNGNLSPLNQL